MIDEADKDGDGEVSEAEFLRIMKKTNMYWVYYLCRCPAHVVYILLYNGFYNSHLWNT